MSYVRIVLDLQLEFYYLVLNNIYHVVRLLNSRNLRYYILMLFIFILLYAFFLCNTRYFSSEVESTNSDIQEVNTGVNETGLQLTETLLIDRRAEDGYINISKLFSVGNKRLDDWLKKKDTKIFLHELAINLKCTETDLISYRWGGVRNRKVYAHREVALEVAKFVFPQFRIPVNRSLASTLFQEDKDLIRNSAVFQELYKEFIAL